MNLVERLRDLGVRFGKCQDPIPVPPISVTISPRDEEGNFFLQFGNGNPIPLNGTEEERLALCKNMARLAGKKDV